MCFRKYYNCGMSTTPIYAWESKWSKWLSCHADFQKVGKCCTRGKSEESIVCRQQSTQMTGSKLALDSRADFSTSFKQGCHWLHTKDWIPPEVQGNQEICTKILFCCNGIKPFFYIVAHIKVLKFNFMKSNLTIQPGSRLISPLKSQTTKTTSSW